MSLHILYLLSNFLFIFFHLPTLFLRKWNQSTRSWNNCQTKSFPISDKTIRFRTFMISKYRHGSSWFLIGKVPMIQLCILMWKHWCRYKTYITLYISPEILFILLLAVQKNLHQEQENLPLCTYLELNRHSKMILLPNFWTSSSFSALDRSGNSFLIWSLSFPPKYF